MEVESDALKVTTTIELQKLGVVPQTVFLRTPEHDGRSPRISSHRFNPDFTVRSPGTPRTHRTLSIDHGPASGAPFEDLRRRLALINGSANSLAVPGSREPRSPVPHPLSVDTGMLAPPPDLPPTLERPSSPAESTVSTTNSSAFRAMRFPIGGDGQKAAPAVGSSKASATGLLDAHAQLLSEGSQSPSGRSSPVSVAGTVRGQERPRVPSIVPISSYGELTRSRFGQLRRALTSSLDGQEPGISNLLEHLYLDNNRDLQDDFGPRVHDGPVRRRNAARHSFMPRDGSARRLEASLVAHFNSHSEAITGIAVSPDHLFFVSASDESGSQSLSNHDKSTSEHDHGYHTGLQDSPPKVRINTDPKMLSGASLGDMYSSHTLDTPLRLKLRVGKERSVPPSPSRPIPAAPQPRRSVSGPMHFRGKEISSPVLNPGTPTLSCSSSMILIRISEASRHLNQLVNRNGGTPIPIDIYEKTGRAASLNTG